MMKSLSGKISYSSRKYFYHFTNVRVVDEEIIYCEINKVMLRHTHEELISKEQLQYSQVAIDDLYEFGRFCIFPDHTIAMTSKAKFDSEELIRVFIELFNKNSEEMVSLSINYQKDDQDIFRIIKGFKKMIRVEIKKLRKSNPDPKPFFDKIEKFLDNEKTDEFSADFKSDEGSPTGLSRDFDSHIMSAISLTDSGYGQSIIMGIDGITGQLIVIDTEDNIIQGRIEKIERGEASEFVKRVLKRFAKHIKSEHIG